MNSKNEKQDNSRGSLTVEALLFLIPFIMAFCTIINAARYVQAEVIIHHALTQTAKQISTYSYVLTKAGISEKIKTSNGKSERFKTDLEKATSSIEGFAEAAGSPDELAEGFLSSVKAGIRDEAMTMVIGELAEESIKNSVSLMSDDPDEFLENIGIEGGLSGLDFSDSEWMTAGEDEKGNVQLVVTYTMKNLIFPDFDFGQYEFCQCASTLIW